MDWASAALLARKVTTIVLATLVVAESSVHAASPASPECPRRGTLEIVDNPAAWADRCFAAVNGRAPQPGATGETESASRDMDLDNVSERLEIRGVGNAVKQIYVFKVTARGFVYLGELNAHPSFIVAPDSSGIPKITYIYRAGAGEAQVRHIQYRDGLYAEFSVD